MPSLKTGALCKHVSTSSFDTIIYLTVQIAQLRHKYLQKIFIYYFGNTLIYSLSDIVIITQMANKGKMSMLSIYEPVALNSLKFLSKLEDLKAILLESPLKPENLNDTKFDANDCVIQGKPHFEKKKPHQNKEHANNPKQHHRKDDHNTAPTTTIVRNQEDKKTQQPQQQSPPAQVPQLATSHSQKQAPQTQQHHEGEETHVKKKVYKKGPCAIFFTLNDEAGFDKDAEVWYYKEGKQIIGPVSSYNMDKMVYHKTIEGETRVAFKSIEKFVKFSKIQAIVQEHQQEVASQQTATTSESKPEQKQQPKEAEKKEEKAPVGAQTPAVEAPAPVSPAVGAAPTPAQKKKINLEDPNEFPSL